MVSSGWRQNQWYHFGVGAPLMLVYFSGDWDVHWGYGFLTHGHLSLWCPVAGQEVQSSALFMKLGMVTATCIWDG